jgi:hypothetical protein
MYIMHTDWLIDYLQFYVPLKNIALIWRCHHCWWRAAKFRPMLGAQGLWAERDLYRATPVVTRGLSFSGLIRRTAPFSCLLRHPCHKRRLNMAVLRMRTEIFYLSVVRLCRSPYSVRIRVIIDHPHTLVCGKRQLKGAVLRMRPEKNQWNIGSPTS